MPSRWVLALYAAIILLGTVIAAPNLFTAQQLAALPSWVPKHQVTLGLDLRGGSHLVLEVDAKAMVHDRLQNLLDDTRGKLREEKIQTQGMRVADGTGLITFADSSAMNAALPIIRTLIAPPTPMAAPEIDVAAADNQIRLTMTQTGMRDRAGSAIEQSLEIIRKRVDDVGVAEPTIQRVGLDRILVQLPGLQDPSALRELLGSTAQMNFHMVSPTMPQPGHPMPGVTIMPSTDGTGSYAIENRVALAGERLTDSRVSFDPQTREPLVTFKFDRAGAMQFADITRHNVHKPFAIVLDGKVLSAPVIQEPIIGGTGQIKGHFTVEKATVLSALLRAGALPAPLTVIEERTVGPDLGGDAIARGLSAGLVGFGLVFGFMFLLYGRWGLIANFALALNVVLTFGALTLMGATLTLPGIAGIILGIGLAVDANVLINERIREESRKGMNAISALNAGFNRAYATIVDSNVTALIATTLLFMFGSGPVRGFAVTMGLGIGISMFTAVSIVRVVMTYITRRYRLKKLDIQPLFGFQLIPEGTKIKFMNARFAGIAFSAVLSLASIGLFIKPGLNYGVDFKGGIQMEVITQGPADLAKMRGGLGGLNLGQVALQEFGTDSHVLVRAERQPGDEQAQTHAVEAIRAKVMELAPGAKIERTEVVGPKVSGELATAGVMAVGLASVAMLIYIWVRFDWPFAVGAIATLILDVTKTVGFFALLGIDFDLTAIAALLTLIGYSVNDKVVVYDRMRENMRLYKQMSLRDMIDKSINETLARSLYTSITAFLAMLPMAIWGGSAVSSFALPMVFGIAIAASSSVFIAAPILLFLGDWRKRRRAALPDVETGPVPVTQ